MIGCLLIDLVMIIDSYPSMKCFSLSSLLTALRLAYRRLAVLPDFSEKENLWSQVNNGEAAL